MPCSIPSSHRPEGTGDDRSQSPAGYPDATFYIQRLSEGVGTIAAAFYPRRVIVRMERFQIQRVRLVDWRQPIRAERGESDDRLPRRLPLPPSESFADCFAMECAAMVQVREVMGLDQRGVDDPVRAHEWPRRDLVLAEMAKYGLRRGDERAQGVRDARATEQRVLIDELASASLALDQLMTLLSSLSASIVTARSWPLTTTNATRAWEGDELRLARWRAVAQRNPLGRADKRHRITRMWPTDPGPHRLDEPQPDTSGEER